MKQKCSNSHRTILLYMVHEAFNCTFYARSQTLCWECASLDKAECI